LSNPVPWQNWMAAYLGYILQMRTLFRGWPIWLMICIREEEVVHLSRRRDDQSVYAGQWFTCLGVVTTSLFMPVSGSPVSASWRPVCLCRSVVHLSCRRVYDATGVHLGPTICHMTMWQTNNWFTSIKWPVVCPVVPSLISITQLTTAYKCTLRLLFTKFYTFMYCNYFYTDLLW